MAVIIRKVENKRDFKAFFEFPWKLYKNDPNWVPPLVSIRRMMLDKKKNPAWEYMEGDYFIALHGDETVGTIAAFVNKWHNEFHDEHIAWFGFFESINDQEVAAALLKTAEDWAREHGYKAVRGPQNFTTHDECGLVIDGFERPIMLMPYNPPYYQALVEGAGFQKIMDTHSLYYDRKLHSDADTENRILRLVDRLKKRYNVTVRPINRKNLRADFEMFKEIYNDAWEKNWGFTPMTEKELDALIESLGAFFDPKLACFVEVEGQPVGFMLGVPDFNQVLHRARPRPGIPEPITLIRALWYWKLRPIIDWYRIPLFGMREAYRKKGFDMMMADYFMDVMRDPKSPYNHMDSGWILETNHDMLGPLLSVGMKIYKTYRFYEKPLV